MKRVSMTALTVLTFFSLAFSGFIQQQPDQYPYPASGSDGQTVLIPMWALVDEGVDPG